MVHVDLRREVGPTVKLKRPDRLAFFALVALLGAFVVVVSLADGGRGREAIGFYHAIASGMTRAQVQTLMGKTRRTQSTMEHTDIFIFQGRFMLAITYGPPPGTGGGNGYLDDDWVAREKVCHDFRDPSSLSDQLATALRIRGPRFTAGERDWEGRRAALQAARARSVQAGTEDQAP